MWQSLLAMSLMTPAALQNRRSRPRRDGWFWLAACAAALGPGAWAILQAGGAWRTGFGWTLWANAAATMAMFAALCLVWRELWRLASPTAAYMLLTVAIASLAGEKAHGAAAHGLATLDAWIAFHIVVALATYALVTLAAIAAVAALIQDVTLKRKRVSRFARALPSLADCDALQVRLLAAGGGVLACGLMTGMAAAWVTQHRLIEISHKTILTTAALMVIAIVFVLRLGSGVRGRRAAQWILLSYLLLALGYPGVKFILDVLMA